MKYEFARSHTCEWYIDTCYLHTLYYSEGGFKKKKRRRGNRIIMKYEDIQ